MTSRSQSVALVALLTSLAVVLNFVFAVPAPFADFLFYEVWEIPVVVALLLIGFWGGASVAVLNAMVLEVVKPGPLPTGPLYNLIAELAMFLGVLAATYLGGKSLSRRSVAVAATALAVVTRTAVMTAVNALVLPMPYPIGFSIPPSAVPGLLLLIGVFNVTVALYTVPLAFAVARAVSSRYRLPGAPGATT